MDVYGDIIIACWLIYLLFWFVSAFFVKKAVTGRNWRLALAWRFAIFIIVFVSVKINGAGAVRFLGFVSKNSFSFGVIGPIVTVIGLIGAVWSRIYLGRNWSGYVTYKEDHELVTTGPYRFVRHPIYSSIILMFIGSILFNGSLLVLLVFVLATIGFVWRIKREEEIMLKLFGEKYKTYMQNTKRLIPGIW